jgi:hypothetical protein
MGHGAFVGLEVTQKNRSRSFDYAQDDKQKQVQKQK